MTRTTVFRTLTRAMAIRSFSTYRIAAPRVLPTSSAARSILPAVATQLQVRSYALAIPPLTVQEIEDRILQLLKDFEKVDPAKLNIDSHFINDLGLDSLDQVEITMALEDEFRIELPDRDAEEIFTVRQAVEKVYANKNSA
ncbi:NADH dehydrogenase 1, alpha/beta subcomplex subunit 1 ndufab1/ACP [Rhizophlyctis rosea]|uniref:Acyl carrier protein n=1 Tax=Rhizophlyctis rosea TaxID=64517 RepID=A0AAD5SIR8_9FUNG|nr:NADH dehydrogenase 1, alpha/beta subcomplex subunit 1 ndufab1/ACP [Rhizophlyctis rosea]